MIMVRLKRPGNSSATRQADACRRKAHGPFPGLESDSTPVESDSRVISLFEHDLRANALRLSRGKTGSHFSGSCSKGCGDMSAHGPMPRSAWIFPVLAV